MSTTRFDENDHFNETVATFGDRLEAAREAKGLTLDSLAEKLGVDAGTLEAWESDADAPRGNRIQMLAGLLNVSIVWLITGEASGTSHVAETYERPTGVNDTIGEISQMKEILSGVLEKLDKLEKRLQETE